MNCFDCQIRVILICTTQMKSQYTATECIVPHIMYIRKYDMALSARIIWWLWIWKHQTYQRSLRPSGAYMPDRRKVIIWTTAGILLIAPLGINFNCNRNHTFSLKNMHFKLSSAFSLGLNVLIHADTRLLRELNFCSEKYVSNGI